MTDKILVNAKQFDEVAEYNTIRQKLMDLLRSSEDFLDDDDVFGLNQMLIKYSRKYTDLFLIKN